jgi:hypothetical protein
VELRHVQHPNRGSGQSRDDRSVSSVRIQVVCSHPAAIRSTESGGPASPPFAPAPESWPETEMNPGLRPACPVSRVKWRQPPTS